MLKIIGVLPCVRAPFAGVASIGVVVRGEVTPRPIWRFISNFYTASLTLYVFIFLFCYFDLHIVLNSISSSWRDKWHLSLRTSMVNLNHIDTVKNGCTYCSIFNWYNVIYWDIANWKIKENKSKANYWDMKQTSKGFKKQRWALSCTFDYLARPDR